MTPNMCYEKQYCLLTSDEVIFLEEAFADLSILELRLPLSTHLTVGIYFPEVLALDGAPAEGLVNLLVLHNCKFPIDSLDVVLRSNHFIDEELTTMRIPYHLQEFSDLVCPLEVKHHGDVCKVPLDHEVVLLLSYGQASSETHGDVSGLCFPVRHVYDDLSPEHG